MGRFLFLIQVMMHGWSKDAIRAAAVELGRPSVVAGLVKVTLNFFYLAIITLPSKGGGAELVQHHVDLCNKQLNTWMEEEVKRQKEVEGRVKIGKFVREAVVRT